MREGGGDRPPAKVFRNTTDRENFLTGLAGLVARGVLSVYAWARVPNHFQPSARTRAAVGARKPIDQTAVKTLGSCGAEVVRLPGVRMSNMNRRAATSDLPEVQMVLQTS